ncbi:alcohol dehydrogenase class IV [Rubricella aquisinus]|uniref:Alcohol dehydrogenase class IV n=1 Tax=Rubricella aquisinus TaxID=2028108 RepID=A0A840WNE6_9RHOB|nr:iron-containing alcohol dehydrogenase [Rubricella aquisinus]MBB5516579.1 alcohol dehydrogenase class IV [Rubricella aquisinus]
MFHLAPLPPITFGAGQAMTLALPGTPRSVLLIADPVMRDLGMAERIAASLPCPCTIFSDIPGEPKAATLRAAVAAYHAARADVVIGLGGGSALDVAKITANIAAGSGEPMDYALAAAPLPPRAAFTVMIPTTAGTGSELSATNIFSGDTGEKLWIWGVETRPDLVVLDPELTTSLPAALTAWCGMDAFVHAFEAMTNRNGTPATALFSEHAMRLIWRALPVAVAEPGNLTARGEMLWASALAGAAIDLSGTAMAHHLSHALAGCAPVQHGLATALAFEASLPWLIETPTPKMEAAARALDCAAADLPAKVSGLMDACGINRALPAAFQGVTVAQAMTQARLPGNMPMRVATDRDVTDGDVERLLGAVLGLA